MLRFQITTEAASMEAQLVKLVPELRYPEEVQLYWHDFHWEVTVVLRRSAQLLLLGFLFRNHRNGCNILGLLHNKLERGQ